jgi:hypothetical protein
MIRHPRRTGLSPRTIEILTRPQSMQDPEEYRSSHLTSSPGINDCSTLQFQYVEVNKLNSAGTVQIGQRFETLAARDQAAW